jgi:hypothetical protein
MCQRVHGQRLFRTRRRVGKIWGPCSAGRGSGVSRATCILVRGSSVDAGCSLGAEQRESRVRPRNADKTRPLTVFLVCSHQARCKKEKVRCARAESRRLYLDCVGWLAGTGTGTGTRLWSLQRIPTEAQTPDATLRAPLLDALSCRIRYPTGGFPAMRSLDRGTCTCRAPAA